MSECVVVLAITLVLCVAYYSALNPFPLPPPPTSPTSPLGHHGLQDATEDGESLLSLACSAGYYELAEVLLRMRASVEDRGIKGELYLGGFVLNGSFGVIVTHGAIQLFLICFYS